MVVVIILLVVAFCVLVVLDVLFQKKPDSLSDCFNLFTDEQSSGLYWLFSILTASTLIVELFSGIFLSDSIHILWQAVGCLIALCGGFMLYLGLSKRYYSWWTDNLKGENNGIPTDGIFSFSRNPEYIGAVLFHIGMSVALSSVVIGILCVICAIMGYFTVNAKEKLYAGKYSDYEEYVKRVNKLLGRRMYPITDALAEEASISAETENTAQEVE